MADSLFAQAKLTHDAGESIQDWLERVGILSLLPQVGLGRAELWPLFREAVCFALRLQDPEPDLRTLVFTT